MTLSELIVKLQELKAAGHGNNAVEIEVDVPNDALSEDEYYRGLPNLKTTDVERVELGRRHRKDIIKIIGY